jgi:probable rRNA maturation factor
MMVLEHADHGAGGAGSGEALMDMDEDPDRSPCAEPSVTIAVDVRAAGWRRASPGVEAAVREAATAALRAGANTHAAPEGVEVSLVLADDAAIRMLNRDYRGRDAPTNVLAFPQHESFGEPAFGGPAHAGPVLLGDVVLALETVRREAAAQGKSTVDHARHLVVHGILHLLGYDHDAESDAADMERRETAILAGLGIADPYAGDAAPAAPVTPEGRDGS